MSCPAIQHASKRKASTPEGKKWREERGFSIRKCSISMRMLNLNENAQSQTAYSHKLKEHCEGAANTNEQVYAQIQTACVRTAVYIGACTIPWIRAMLKLKVYYVLRTAAVGRSCCPLLCLHKNTTRTEFRISKQNKINSTSSLYVLTYSYLERVAVNR